jgi:hypothetical protein
MSDVLCMAYSSSKVAGWLVRNGVTARCEKRIIDGDDDAQG